MIPWDNTFIITPSGRSALPPGPALPGQLESPQDHLLRGAPRRYTARQVPLPPFHRAILTRPLRRYLVDIFRRVGSPQRPPTAHGHTGRCRPAARNGPRPGAVFRPPWMERSPQLAEVRAEPAVAAPGAATGARTVRTRTPHGGSTSARLSRGSSPGTAGSSRTPAVFSACLPITGYLESTRLTRVVGPCGPSARAGRTSRQHFRGSLASMRAGTVPFATSSGSAFVPGSQTAGCVCGVHGLMMTH